jgi:hypothetical protein
VDGVGWARSCEQAVAVVGGLVGGGPQRGRGRGRGAAAVGVRVAREARRRTWVAAVISNREREKDRRKMLPGGGYFE